MKRILKHTLILSMLTCTLTFSTNTKASVADTSLNESTTNEVTTTYNLSETSLSNDTKAVSLPSDKSDYIKSDLSPLTSKVIVLDPGHCKKHIGARGYGLKEEDIVLDISKACKNKLDNLCVIVYNNNLQIDGTIQEVKNLYQIDEKFKSFGFEVIKIDGHNIEEIIKALEKAKTIKEKPTCIIAKTIKGKGISYMENQAGWHGKAPNQEQYLEAVKELK